MEFVADSDLCIQIQQIVNNFISVRQMEDTLAKEVKILMTLRYNVVFLH